MSEPISVIIADDIDNTREDIKRLLYFEEDIEVVGEAVDGEEAIAMARELRPDIILMDINMPKMDGISATEAITLEVQECAIIIISIQGEQEYLRKAMTAGAREFLVKPFSATELADTIRKVYETHQKRSVHLQTPQAGNTKKPAGRTKGQLVSFFSTKGGVGKTTLATNLAVSLSQKTKKGVVLVDLDLMAGDMAVLLNINAKSTIADLVQEEEEIDFTLVDSFLIPHLSGTRLLAAPNSPEQAELVRPEHVEKILAILRENFDYVLVDTSPVYNDINLGVLEASDQVLLVMTQELTSLKQTTTAIEILNTLNYAPKVRVVLNQHSNESGLKPADLEKSISGGLSALVPHERKIVRDAVNKGIPFVMTQADSRITQAIREMISALSLAGQDAMVTDEQPKKSVISRIFSF